MSTQAPRWKIAIAKALREHEKSVVIQLATVDTYSSAKSNIAIPHVRSHIFRDFVSAESTPSLPLLLTSTDIRTPKSSQIISNPHIEVAWWIEGTEEQYRFAGLAHIVSAPDHTLHSHFANTVSSPALTALQREGFDWETKRKDVFNSMSGHMKASWCRPTPGSRLVGGAGEAAKWPVTLPKLGRAESDDEEKSLKMALQNFALVVIDPIEVDYVELVRYRTRGRGLQGRRRDYGPKRLLSLDFKRKGTGNLRCTWPWKYNNNLEQSRKHATKR